MKIQNIAISMVVLLGALALPGCEIVPEGPYNGYNQTYYDSNYYEPGYDYGTVGVYPAFGIYGGGGFGGGSHGGGGHGGGGNFRRGYEHRR